MTTGLAVRVKLSPLIDSKLLRATSNISGTFVLNVVEVIRCMVPMSPRRQCDTLVLVPV